MNQTRTLVEMGNFYEKAVIEEKKSVFPPKDTFKMATDKKPVEAEAKKDAFVQKNSGPENADGFRKDIVDPKTTKKENFYEPKKFSQNCEKTEVKTINNFMSKSIFDKLYEDVMSDQAGSEASDAEALGLPSAPEAGAGEGETKEEVTLTLPHDLAVKLHELLSAVIGEEEAGDEGETDEVSGEDAEANVATEADEDNEEEEKEEDSDEDAENVAKEATELKELPVSAGQSLQKKDNKVGDVTKSLVSSGGGDGKVTDKVGNDGEKGHALVGGGVKGGASTSPKGKANVVASKTSKVGAYLAGLK